VIGISGMVIQHLGPMIGHPDSPSSEDPLRRSHTPSHPFDIQRAHSDTRPTFLRSRDSISRYFAQFRAFRIVSQPFARFRKPSYISQPRPTRSPTSTDIPTPLPPSRPTSLTLTIDLFGLMFILWTTSFLDIVPIYPLHLFPLLCFLSTSFHLLLTLFLSYLSFVAILFPF